MARRGIRPTVNALATIMVTVVFAVIIIANQISIRNKYKNTI
jgi:spermidine/putrescine transport system permease protein